MRCRLADCGTVSLGAIVNAIGFAKFNSRSHGAVIRVYDDAGNVIETHEHAGEFKEAVSGGKQKAVTRWIRWQSPYLRKAFTFSRDFCSI